MGFFQTSSYEFRLPYVAFKVETHRLFLSRLRANLAEIWWSKVESQTKFWPERSKKDVSDANFEGQIQKPKFRGLS